MARIRVGLLYNSGSGLRATLEQKEDQIVQWVSLDVDLEAERPSVMSPVAA